MSKYRVWWPLFLSAAILATGSGITSCGSSTSGTDTTNGSGGGGTGGGSSGGTVGVKDSDFAVFIQADSDSSDENNVTDTIAVVSLANGEIISTFSAEVGGGALQASNKSYFHDGNLFFAGGGNIWGFDPKDGALIPRKDTPSFQANREGLVGQNSVNTKSARSAQVTKSGKNLNDFVNRTQMTAAEMKEIDMCDVQNLVRVRGGISTRAAADTTMHNTGYSPVGIEMTPDGKMLALGVRQGDHLLFMDVDPASDTFAEPSRFVILRTGEIKDKNNDVVATFASQYAGFGGTAPGDLDHPRADGATGGETDGETYVEPCDSNMVLNAAGETWFGSVDVDGDTITVVRVDTITSDTPTVIQVAVPVVDDAADAGGSSGLQYVGPWMGAMHNRDGGNEMLLSSENEGENSESIFDLSDPANPVEVERLIPDLATVKAAAGGRLDGPFVVDDVYAVNVDFTSTGGGANSVDYTYKSLGGDNLTGRSQNVTTAYLAKVNAGDPGPNFIVNGLNGRPGTSEGNFGSTTGTGTETTVFSDELWLSIFRGPSDIYQKVNLAGDAPWKIDKVCDLVSSFGFIMTPNNRIIQNAGGNLQVIDTDSCTIETTISLPGGSFRGGPVIAPLPAS